MMQADVGPTSFDHFVVHVAFRAVDVDDVTRQACDEHSGSFARCVFVERVHVEVGVTRNGLRRCGEYIEKFGRQSKACVRHLDDDGQLGTAGIDPLERRTHCGLKG